jgi:GNAT superfamily N-acetyltransferase
MTSIRPADDADMAAVADLWHEGWHDGHAGHVPDGLTAARTLTAFHERTPSRVTDTAVAVAEDGSLQGFVMVVDDEVEQVYVSSDHRGSGVAGVLLAEAERQVKANGHSRAWLAVATGNLRARRFYERSGWTDAGAFDYPAATEAGPIPVPCHLYVRDVR